MTEEQIVWADELASKRAAPDLERLDDIVWRGESKWPDRLALIGEDLELTYGELADHTRRLASGFLEKGIGCDDKVILQAPSSPVWILVYFSLVSIGASVIPLATDRSEEGVKRAIRLARPKMAIIDPEVEKDIYDQSGVKLDIYVIRNNRRFINRMSAQVNSDFPLREFCANQIASICFTSGTTGEAKGVCLSHRNFCFELRAIYQIEKFGPGDRFLSILPSFHAYEFTGGQMLPLYAGATIVYAQRLTSETLMKHFSEDKITIMLAVPLVYQKMLDRMRRKSEKGNFLKRWFSKGMVGLGKMNNFAGEIVRGKINRKLVEKKGFKDLRLLISGGAPLNPDIPETFRGLGLEMLQGYGLTETSPVVTVNPPGSPYPDSIGKVLPGLRVGVLNPDDSGEGEIIIEGPVIFERYLGEKQRESERFNSGDVGYVKDGYLFISGRKKHTIVTAEGKNIHPEKIEEVYEKSPLIKEIIVVGEPRSDGSGDRPKAIIYPDEDNIAAETETGSLSDEYIFEVIGEEIKKYGEQLQDHQRVRGYELRWEPFPRTPTQKIKRYLFDNSSRPVE